MEKNFDNIVPVVQLRNASFLCYNQSLMSRARNSKVLKRIGVALMESEAFRQNVEELKKTEKYSGNMTAGAKKRLVKAISLMVTSTPRRYQLNRVTNKVMSFQLSFTTLTIPNCEMAKDAKLCHKVLLEPMLRILRRKYKMKSYVWKCELQKNGSVHYHLTSDVFVIHTELRDNWNALLRKEGFLVEFQKEYGHDNPNSTDIHSTRDIRNMEAYIIKYVSKSVSEGRILNAKVWDASLNLKKGKFYSSEIDSKLEEVIRKSMSDGEATVIELERCTIVKFPSHEYINYYFTHIMSDFYKHLKSIRNWVRDNSKKVKEATTSLIDKYKPVTVTNPQLQLNFSLYNL